MGWPSSSRSERFPPPAQFFRLDLKGITRERFFVYPPCTLRCGSGACGYAVTSHSSRGQTADRVLVHVDTQEAGKKLVIAAWRMWRGRVAATEPTVTGRQKRPHGPAPPRRLRATRN